MRSRPWLLFATLVASWACGGQRASSDDVQPVTPERAAMIETGVRAFAHAVARDVSRDGPTAWRAHFADHTAFFMAANGHLVFPTSVAATEAIEDLTHSIRQIDLRWGDPLSVDPLAPGLAALATPYSEVRVDAEGRRVEEAGYVTGLVEYRNDHWQFRNLHWSVAAQPVR